MSRILFVDDEPNVHHALRRMLHSAARDWEMIFVGTAGEALDALANQGPFDVVVSDMRMPDMNGAELFQRIKSQYPGTIRFALSGDADSDTMLKASVLTHRYLTKPCEPAHLQSVLMGALALRSHFSNNALIQKLNAVGALPSIPVVYQQVMTAIESAETSVGEIAELIERDASLSAKLLQVVNSAYIGLRYEVNSLKQAASLMGLDRLRVLVLMAEIFEPERMGKLPRGFDMNRLWNHSVKVGLCARAIAECETEDKLAIDRSYTAGLLHDIGLIVLATSLPEEFRAVIEKCTEEHLTTFEAERAILDTTHAEVGGYLLELWGLPETVVEAITFHGYPSAYPEVSLMAMTGDISFHPLTAVHAANYFCTDAGRAADEPEGEEMDAFYLESMKVSDSISRWWDACAGHLTPA